MKQVDLYFIILEYTLRLALQCRIAKKCKKCGPYYPGEQK